jgi:hypothetical protein
MSSTCGLRLPVFPSKVQYSAYGLLLTNKQLRLETKDRLHQLPSPYALDVMLVGDDNHYDELWPTWLCCPSRRLETIKVVEINIRNFGDETVPYLVRLNAICGFADFRLPAKSGASLLCDLLDYVVSICASKSNTGMHSIETIKVNGEVPSAFDDYPKEVDAAKMVALWGANIGDEYSLHSEILSSEAYEYRADNYPMSLRLLAYGLIAAIVHQKDWNASPRPFSVRGNELGGMAFSVDGHDKTGLIATFGHCTSTVV